MRQRAIHAVAIPAIVAAVLLLSSCATKTAGRMDRKMGDQVQLGSLIYTVLEVDWDDSIGQGVMPANPQNEFLILRLSVTNSGGTETAVPLLNVEDAQGNSFRELSENVPVENWLGVLRRMAPATTDQGRIVFELPRGTYRLRISDGSEPDKELFAFIEIPYRLSEPVEEVETEPEPEPRPEPAPAPKR